MRFFKSLPLYIGLGVMAAGAALPAHAGDAGNYTVELNKTEILRLPGAAASIIVGNPKIADVTVQSSDLLFVVGRGYGETNLIILDAQGNTMMNADLQVVNTLSDHGVRLYNGKNRETYSCIPFCGPSPVLGDTGAFIAGNTSNERNLTSFPAFNASSSAPIGNTAPAGAPPSASNGPMPQQQPPRRPS
jgi:hypothetical protein